MFRQCCVPKCKTLRKDAKLHRFPVKKETRDQWLQNINCENLLNMNNLVDKVFVCHKHFEKRYVTPSNRLKIGSVPTLFTEFEINSGNPTSTHDCTKSDQSNIPSNRPNSDHNYSLKQYTDHTYCTPMEIIGTVVVSGMDSTCCAETITTVTTENPGTSGLIGMDSTHCAESITTVTTENLGTSGLIESTPRRFSKKRLIRNLKSLSPRCRLLYSEYKKARRQSNFLSRAKKAVKFSKEGSFEKLTRNMNPWAKNLLWMQVKLCMKTKKGRRFTMNDKLIGLAIYKQSPKQYKFLQKIFILPSKTTLKAMISRLNIDAGVNSQIFGLVKEQVNNWEEKKKLCTIMFDEMALEPALTYAQQKDSIDGFVHLNTKTSQFADHALVFMLRGAVYKWQQPLAFYFCEGQTKMIDLKAIIKSIISAVTETGLRPIALVSDQGSSFQSALNDLLEETKRDQLHAAVNVDDMIHLYGNSLSVFYDPPHLIKGIRNNFLTKNMEFEDQIATWQDIVDVYNTDCRHGQSRILHKLTDEHVIPSKIKKMKVKNCVRVLSKTVSAALSYTSQFPLYPDGKPVSKTIKNTAHAISFFDDLFDSVNGAGSINKKNKAKHLRQAVTTKSPHHNFWKDAIKKLKKIKFITKFNQKKTVPSLKNWVVTLNSFQRVWRFLSQEENIRIMRPRYFNSDPIENFFGQVRAYNYRSNNPNVNAFKNTFKSLLITRFINFHSESFNCEDDTGRELLSIQSLFKESASKSDNRGNDIVEPIEQSDVINLETVQIQARRERLNVHSRAYTVGWATRKILRKIKCKTCTENLVTSNEESVHDWIKAREYIHLKKRKLAYPTEHAVRSFGIVAKVTNEYLEENAHHNNICLKIKEKIVSEYSFTFINCSSHGEMVLEQFLNISIRLFIFNWCNMINKILKGVDIIRLQRFEPLPSMQSKALCKYKKKLKNKNIKK